MINKADKNGIKAGGVTVELLLAILLSVVVLFLILGLFSDNLKQMIVNSNISRVFANNSAKTTYSNQNADPTQTQEEVQIVADHALDWYFKNAQKLIATYRQIPPDKISETELEDFAKQVTIARIGGSNYINSNDLYSFSNPPPDGYGIKTTMNYNNGDYYTKVINNTTNIILYYNLPGDDLAKFDSLKLDSVLEILRKPFVIKN